MLKILLTLFLLVSACVAIHGTGIAWGMRWLERTAPRCPPQSTFPRTFGILSRVVCGLLMLHLLEIFVWALCYHWNGCFSDFDTSFYYSATSYSTAGYGDVIPTGAWRTVGSIEAVTGILLFGWSTGVLFSVANLLQGRLNEPERAGPPGGHS